MKEDVRNPKLIVKNGVFLFVRLLLVMAMAFYTTRLSLKILGDVDYGINDIIGGVISMFAIISMPITGALQRFFNVEFTKQEISPETVFSTSIRIIAILAIGMAVLYETIGLYLVNHVLQYPLERTFAVNVIFQISVIITAINFFSLTYSSLLFAKEDMGVPATVEVMMAVLKLCFLLLIPFVSLDALIAYSIMLLCLSLFQLLYYILYCRKNHPESRITKGNNKQLKNNILVFAGWSSINAVAGISLTYLSNIFINVFGGVLYNTAYGLSMQLSNAVMSFSSNVLKAVDPQITSSTTSHQDDYRNQLALSTLKVSLFGVGICAVIFFIWGDRLLQIWLGHVPLYVNDFCRISLLNVLFGSIVLPLRTIILATGNVKRFFINYGLFSLIALTIIFILLKLGFPPVTVLYMVLSVSIANFISAVCIVHNMTSLKASVVLKQVSLIMVSLLLFYTLLLISHLYLKAIIPVYILSLIAALFLTAFFYYKFCLSVNEKEYLITIIKRFSDRIRQ